MSIKQYPGGIITKNPTAPTTSSAKGIWTVCQAANYAKQGIWPRIPGAPTIGTATVAGGTSASVAFTAPADTGAGGVTYTAISTPGSITATGTSPITVSGLTSGTAYTFQVYGTTPGGTGPLSAASNSVTPVITCATYTTAGTFSWVAPTGVTSVAAVAIGGGGGGWFDCPNITSGSGGGLGYKNGISVSPGSSYTVVVGAGGSFSGGGFGSISYFNCATIVAGNGGSKGGAGGAFVGDGGGNGGAGRSVSNPTGCGTRMGVGGGGAGGYSGAGGQGGRSTGCGGAGCAGSGGGGGGGYVPPSACLSVTCFGPGAGGGTGIYGQGSNGAAGTATVGCRGGKGGSGGTNGSCKCNCYGIGGGAYGGGNMFWRTGAFSTNGNRAHQGAVRIVWCIGGARGTPSFPSTNVGP